MRITAGVTFFSSPAKSRRAGNIWPDAVLFPYPMRYTVMKQPDIILADINRILPMDIKLLLPSPVVPGFIYFVIAAPQYNAFILFQPVYLVANLFPYIIKKMRIAGIHPAGKH